MEPEAKKIMLIIGIMLWGLGIAAAAMPDQNEPDGGRTGRAGIVGILMAFALAFLLGTGLGGCADDSPCTRACKSDLSIERQGACFCQRETGAVYGPVPAEAGK